MAIRNTTHVLKNSDIVNRPLPVSLLKGEPIVNTADGILYFSGVTTSTSEWTPAGTGTTANFFEVGSNLYDLKLRNQITKYQGVSGSGLIGKFLSGTSTGFVLADISDINGISGFTYDPSSNTFTITDASGDIYDATIQSVTGLTINGNLDVTGSSTFNDVTISGTGLYTLVATGSNDNEIVNYQTLTGFSQANDVYVTGSTLSAATDNTNTQTSTLLYHATPLPGGPYTIVTENTYTTGGTYDNNTKLISFLRNDGTSGYTVDLTNIDTNDTYVTGGTDNSATVNTPVASIGLLYNQDVAPGTYTLPYSNVFLTGFTYGNNTFTLKDNSGNTFTQVVNQVTGLTVNGNLTVTGETSVQSLTGSTVTLPSLSDNRVVYTTSGGTLTTESNFTYDEGTDTLGVDNIQAAGDVTIQGSLTVFGPSVSAFTSNLYVEDPNITLNYNPTGSTTVTSVNSGFVIQDGNGITSGDVNFDIVRMQNLTGLTATEIPNVSEYVSLTGYANRGWITQLNDIVIRSTDPTDGGSTGDINGVRVLTEFDVLDGGFY